MALIGINQRIVNPVSGISYRLMMSREVGPWRITRSAPAGQAVSLTHLRGEGETPMALPTDLIEQFIQGDNLEGTDVHGHGTACMQQIVLADFTNTSHRLVHAARSARIGYHHGMPGMRKGCYALLVKYEESSQKVHNGWQAMATTWSSSFGRQSLEALPDWMLAAWEVGQIPWDRSAALNDLKR